MIICIFSKFTASLLAIFYVIDYPVKYPASSIWIQAFLIGIFPIWIEVLASSITRTEPARTRNKFLLYLDGVIDLFVFIVIPAIWFWSSTVKTEILFLVLVMFIGCGFFRIIRFMVKGLNSEGKFSGLPVTYTGYVWIIMMGLDHLKLSYLSFVFLIIVSLAMITKKIQISPSR